MSFWKADLTTADGAEEAATMGGLACFIAAGLTALGALFLAGTASSAEERIGGLIGVGVLFIVFVIAGWRLRGGRGAFWGAAAALLMVIEIASKLITMTGIPGIVINVILLVVIVNGVRGAWTLRRGFPEDVAEVFR